MSLDVDLVGPRCPTCQREPETFFSANITHNLSAMALEAGIYEALWRPEEIGITRAAQLDERLEKGLAALEATPSKFRRLNPPNGWGTYEGLVDFVKRYLAACRQWPSAEVRACR